MVSIGASRDAPLSQSTSLMTPRRAKAMEQISEAQASLTTSLEIHNFASVEYLALPLQKLPLRILEAASLCAVTFLSLETVDSSSPDHLGSIISRWLEVDDVFNPHFLEKVIILSLNTSATGRESIVSDYLRRRWNVKSCFFLSTESLSPNPPLGPAFIRGDELYRPFRLYDDVNQAFMLATKPRVLQSAPFENLRISGQFPSSISVAVSSRASRTVAAKAPLHGLRFAVKDLFEIDGLRPTLGCRAYYEVAQTHDATAPLIQSLLDMGAELVGTLKMGSLITKEEPAESADFQAPFNPRADGYQSAWSSSGGSGAAIAAYDWLDFTLGTDTTGSSRRPAMANGCFQIRLSSSALSQQGIVPSFRPFDAPAVFSRSIGILQQVVPQWIGSAKNSSADTFRIICIEDYLPVGNAHQQAELDRFVQDMSSTLSAEVIKLSLTRLWETSAPPESRGQPLDKWLKDVGVTSFCYGLYEELKPFRKRYHDRFNKEPYVNPTTRWRWNAAQHVSQEDHHEAMNKLSVFKLWLLENILRTENSSPLVIIPITTQAEDYRDQPADPPTAPSALQQLWLAPILGAPEISVPIGELEYYSRVSLRNEYLPLVTSVLGSPGTDGRLIETIARVLRITGRPSEVFTGSRMFTKPHSH